MVKELRDQTGAGMMDCKAALSETGGDLEAAVDWLRKKGLSKAAKKAGRVAAEGLVGVAIAGNKGIVVEVNSETDFVARNDLFQGLVKMIADAALDRRLRRRTRSSPRKAGSITIADAIADTIAKVGENMTLRRAAELSVGKGVVASYVHNSVIDGLGRIGVIVALESAGKPDELKAFGRMVAMHVASANPQAVDPSGLDPATVEREKNVLADKFKAQGKPGQRDRQDRRVRAEDLLQGSLPARAALHLRRQEERGAGRQGGRGARSARRSRSAASCASRSAKASSGQAAISAAKSRPLPARTKARQCRRIRPSSWVSPRKYDSPITLTRNRRRGRDIPMAKPKYRRVIVKLSGEALSGPEKFGIHQPTIDRFAADLVAAHGLGIGLGVVVGGGNVLRGAQISEDGLSRPTADAMGMLATVMNAWFWKRRSSGRA